MNAVITGASRGLGFELASVLAQRGWNVACLNRSSNELFDSLRAQYLTQISEYLVDVSDEDSVKSAARKIAGKSSQLDLLINNAGINLDEPPVDIWDYDFEPAKKMFAVNAIGPMLVMKHFLPLVQAGKGKKVVNISSEAGSIGKTDRQNMFGYCMSKSACNMGSMLVQNFVEKYGIKVLLVNPGWLKTKMGGEFADDEPLDAALELLTTLEQDWPIDGPSYIERNGTVIPW